MGQTSPIGFPVEKDETNALEPLCALLSDKHQRQLLITMNDKESCFGAVPRQVPFSLIGARWITW